MSKRFVGVDLGLHSFDVAVRPDRLHWVVPYTPEGVSEFVKRMTELRPQLVVMEACGNLERPLARALEQSTIPAAVMNPLRCWRDSLSSSSQCRVLFRMRTPRDSVTLSLGATSW